MTTASVKPSESQDSEVEKTVEHTEAAPSSRKVTQADEPPWSHASIFDVGAALTFTTIPHFVTWALAGGLIFGGCCSNVREITRKKQRFCA